ncbi:MAG: efflux transporter outer membrane subunit [Proteobacteria bacterium]|nr:efflux transporter outer membrane subunit [Pseudomonadota bacterium]MBS0493576.1 efflux transporter outer membrane subunit [Pseudomonadota bacterium]
MKNIPISQVWQQRGGTHRSKPCAVPARALLIGAALTLAGCTSLAPGYERPSAALPAQYADDNAAATQVAALAWRNYFNEPELQTLIDRALAGNRDLRAAMLRVEEARAAYGISRADRVPTVGLSLQSQRSRVPGDLSLTGSPLLSEQHQLGVGFSNWEIDFWGRIRSLNDAALQTYLASDEGQQAATLLLITQVADSWLVLRELDQRIVLAEAALATRTESRRVFTRRVEVGSSSRLDLVQVELLWQQANTLLSQLRQQRSTQQNALGVLVGEPGLSLAPSTQPLSALAPIRAPAPGLPSQLLENRPDIRSAERSLQAANARIGVARALFFPTISLTTMAGTASSELDGLFGGGSRAWSFAPSVSLPLFDGGRRQANLELSQVQREQAVNQYQKTIQTAFREVADGLVAGQRLNEQLQIQRTSENTLTERARLASRRYAAGAARYFEVLDAERDLLAAQQQTVQTERALMSARLQLYASLGGGTQALATHAAPKPESAEAKE